MRLYPSGKKIVPLPMVGGVVNVEYELAAVLLYNGAHYVCVVRGDPGNEEPTWVRHDGMSTDGGTQGVGSSCVPPDGEHSWGVNWGLAGTLYSRVARHTPGEAKSNEQRAREAAQNAMFAAFVSAREREGCKAATYRFMGDESGRAELHIDTGTSAKRELRGYESAKCSL